MTAYPVRNLHTRTSMVFRQRGGFSRRDKTASSSTGSAAAAATAATLRAENGVSNVHTSCSYARPRGHASPNKSNMQIEGDDRESGDGGAGGAGRDAGAIRYRRVFSAPGAAREIYSMDATSTQVSSVTGITMDIVNGAVRAKTPQEKFGARGAAATGFGAVGCGGGLGQFSGELVGISSLDELAAAVDEVAAAPPPPPPPLSSSLACSAAPPSVSHDLEEEREYRATSMAPFAPLQSNTAQAEGSSKRAKSGIMDWKEEGVAGPATGGGVGGRQGWMMEGLGEGRHGAVLSTPADAATAARAAASTDVARGEGRAVSASGARGKSVAAHPPGVANVAVSGSCEPTTNDAWLATLAPILRKVPRDTHPEDFLHEILRERGYSTEMVSGKGSEFHRPPAPDQVAAYDKAILRAVLDEDEATLEGMRATGRRMDACNRFGDSVLHMACRRGRVGTLRYLLRVCGPTGLVLSDDFGRTVMHDACWTPTPRFDIASELLDVDTRLLRVVDKRGSSPLQYVPRDQWPQWCAYFESRKEVYWPMLAPGQEDIAGKISSG